MAIIREFISEDHIRRARYRPRRIKQVASVSKYIADFHNIVLTIRDLMGEEAFDRFTDRLKDDSRWEDMKLQAGSFEDATWMALRIDGSIRRDRSSSGKMTEKGISSFHFRPSHLSSASEPIIFGNLQESYNLTEAQWCQ